MRTPSVARFALILGILSLAAGSLAGCGGGSQPVAVDATRAASEKAPGPSADVSAAAGASSEPDAARGSSASPPVTTRSPGGATPKATDPSGKPAPPAAPKGPPPISGTPDRACVHPGEMQGLTERGGDPSVYVIYDSVYSNNTDDFTSHYGTGSGKGLAGPDGVYHDTWVLAPTVPAGRVILDFATTYHHSIVKWYTTFVVVPSGASCP